MSLNRPYDPFSGHRRRHTAPVLATEPEAPPSPAQPVARPARKRPTKAEADRAAAGLNAPLPATRRSRPRKPR